MSKHSRHSGSRSQSLVDGKKVRQYASLLFSIPLELRQQIYTYCFRDDQGQPMLYLKHSYGDDQLRRLLIKNTSMLLACRQILHEARPIYARNIVFGHSGLRADMTSVKTRGMPDFMRLNLHTIRCHYVEFAKVDLQPVQLVTRYPNLKLVVITLLSLRTRNERFLELNDDARIKALLFRCHRTEEEIPMAQHFIRQLAKTPRLQVLVGIDFFVSLPDICTTCHGDNATRVLKILIHLKEMRMMWYHPKDMDDYTAQLAIMNKISMPRIHGLGHLKCEGSGLHEIRRRQREA